MRSKSSVGRTRSGRGSRSAVAVASLAAAVTMLASMSACSTDAQARTAAAGGAPQSLDVTNYPPLPREAYQAFADRCTRCHDLGRAITAGHVLPDQWEACVERMRRKFFSGINRATGRQIRDFLIYDASVRRKAEVDAALARLPGDARKAAEDRIAEVRQQFEKEAPSK